MKFRLSILAVLFSSASAFASDTSSSYNWSGAYLGGQAGYASGTSRYHNDVDERLKFSPDGFLGGIYGGYNHQFSSNFVLGFDADFTLADIKDNGKYYDEDGYDANMHSSLKMRWNGAARVRAGYALDRFLPYVAGGLSYGKYKLSVWDNEESLVKSSKTRTGWNIGAGLDYAMTDNLIARVEYRYSDFGKARILDGVSDSINLKTHDARLGIAYKF
ncbi:Outer membrane protein beta-barrel domain protein [compost metagenome]